MSKFSRVVLSVAVLGLVVLVGIVMVGGGSGSKVAQAESKPNALPAVPTKDELFDFDNYTVDSGTKGAITVGDVMVYRKADKARLWVVAVIAATESDAKKWVEMQAIHLQTIGPFAKGSSSGRVIGEECWNSNRDGGPPRGSLEIFARDGRAAVDVQFAPPPPRDKKGNPILDQPLDPKDVDFVEKHAIKVLDKLTKMGYTSKSPK